MPDRIVAEELALLDRIASVLRDAPEAEPISEDSIVEELKHVREQLLRGSGDEFERATLTSRWNVLTALRRQLEESRKTPQIDRTSPYFAHLRLREGERERDLCLGKGTYLDHGVRIVDWRHAPIAQLFYRYQQGEEFEEELSGRMFVGEIAVRRTVAIQNCELERVEAPEGSFVSDHEHPEGWRQIRREPPKLAGGQGAALRVHRTPEATSRALGTDLSGTPQRADKHLPDIAGLIDPEQFELITRPSAGFVAIRGTAGSGKTTVALHRIAYLAYDDPSIDSPRTLFLVFSQALRDYVSHVLPALGVNGVRVQTYREWAAEQRARLFPMLPTVTRSDTPAPVSRLKLHPMFLTALERHVARVPGPATPEQAIDDWQSVLCNQVLLEEVLNELAPEAMSPRELERATAWTRRRNEELGAWLDGDHDEAGELDAEDDALLLRAWQLRVGSLTSAAGHPLEYRHIAIDEVQDFSPLEVRVLLDCLDERKSLTLAGDTQQHVVEDSGFTSWNDFFAHLGIAGTEVSTLQVSYRSTREITEFALGVLGDVREADDPVYTNRSGPSVEAFQFTDTGASVAFLAEALAELGRQEPLASVVVLTPSRDISELVYGGLLKSDVPRVHIVRNQDFRFTPGIEVTEIQQVKGLEFDYVILVGVDETHFPDEPATRRLLHVGATRAVHQLWLAYVGRPSPIVREAISRGVAVG